MSKLKYLGYLLLAIMIFGCEEEKLDIEKYGQVKGAIVDGETYQPLDGVQIVTNPASTASITGNDGLFELNKVKEGELAVTARKKDYLSNTVSIAVYEDQTTNLRFFLLKDENNVGWVTIYDPVPGNGAVDQNVSITFQWSVDQEYPSKELEYTVYYYKSNSTTQQIAGENITEKEVVVDGLSEETTYYWFVVAKHDGLRVANSPTWTFKTGTYSDEG